MFWRRGEKGILRDKALGELGRRDRTAGGVDRQ